MMTKDDQRALLAEVMKHEVRRYPAESDLLRLRAMVEGEPAPAHEAELEEQVRAMPHRFALLHLKALKEMLPLLSEEERSHIRGALERLAVPPPAPQGQG